jgi:hypothetical protein
MPRFSTQIVSFLESGKVFRYDLQFLTCEPERVRLGLVPAGLMDQMDTSNLPHIPHHHTMSTLHDGHSARVQTAEHGTPRAAVHAWA